jgi:hypothetical protein
MAAILLVGIESPFLRILSTVLSQGWSVNAASDQASLEDLLATTQPAVVVFEHTQPFDLYDLNPRRHGYTGPILLIADNPGVAPGELETDILIRKPSNLASLCRLIAELTEGSND